MRLTDISLDWLLPGAVCSWACWRRWRCSRAASVPRARRAADDSWERSEERRRRKEAIYGTASYVLLFCCAAVAAALSFHGLVGFGRQNLNLTGGWEYLVPFGLDGAAMFCSVLAVREASHGDAALGSRMLVWTFAGAAAWFNWVHAPRGLGHAGAPQFFAGMSLSAAVLFDRALKQTRRAALREQGLVPRPLPQIRIVRWLRAPRETYGAWSLMLLEGVRIAGRGGRRGPRGPAGEGAGPAAPARPARSWSGPRSRRSAGSQRTIWAARRRRRARWSWPHAGAAGAARSSSLPRSLPVADAGATARAQPGPRSRRSTAPSRGAGAGNVPRPSTSPPRTTPRPCPGSTRWSGN